MTRVITTTVAGAAILYVAATGFAPAAESAGDSQPQGVYSAEQLLEADVYTKGGAEIGEIEDIIFDNEMNIKSFAVETESSFGLAGKAYVVPPEQISVETHRGDEATEPEYRMILDTTADELRRNPVYSDSWWNRTQEKAGQAWQATKETAGSAWTTIKQGTADLVNEAGEAADDAVDATGEAAEEAGDTADDAADETSKAADNAADKAGEAADETGQAAEDAAEGVGDAAGDAADSTQDAAD